MAPIEGKGLAQELPTLHLNIDSRRQFPAPALIAAGAIQTLTTQAQDRLKIYTMRVRPANAANWAIHSLVIHRTTIITGPDPEAADIWAQEKTPPLDVDILEPACLISMQVENISAAADFFFVTFFGLDVAKLSKMGISVE